MEINQQLKKYLSEQRYEHSIGVRDTAIKLAEQYGCDVKKAEIAALLHDVARDYAFEDLVRIVKATNPDARFPEKFYHEPLLLHAWAGRIIAKNQFGIDDEEILQSIELHTTGGASMNLLDRIIFVADYIEPGRTMRGVETARCLAFRNLDSAVLFILKSILRYLLAGGRSIIEDTLQAYNELVLKKREKDGNQHRRY